MNRRPPTRPVSASHVAEAIAVAILVALLIGQLASYPTTDDPDPDGYVNYAEHLKSTWALKDTRRLPGYPVFLAVVDSLGPSTMHVDAFWAQAGLFVVWCGVIWFWARRLRGPLAALVVLAILATPCFLTRYSVVMLADFLGSVAFGVTTFALLRMVTSPGQSIDLRWAAGLAALFCLAWVVHPSTQLMLAAFIVFLGISVAIRGGRIGWPGREAVGSRVILPRLAMALVTLFGAISLISPMLDRGSSHYNAAWLKYFVVMCLPPAVETEDDRRIEAMKAAASARLGNPVAMSPPTYYDELIALFEGKFPIDGVFGDRYRTLADLDGGSFPEERYGPLWRGRVTAHPLELARCGGRQMFWKYHIFAKQFTPFASERRPNTYTYLPLTGTLRSQLFRSYGLELADVPDGATFTGLRGSLLRELARLALVVLVTGIGVILLFRQLGAPVLAVVLTIAFWYLFIGLTLPLEPRYFLAFAPGIYLVQAVGIVAIVRFAVRRWTWPCNQSVIRTGRADRRRVA